ncbi:MAG TPA: LysR family transcriptional regulator [Phenylobacterium sp.]|jgi:DNA-binding transcriptional LysR family regulator|nr:LysR family transcriptional regulator [Phenylobacterium sp.]
MIELRRLRYLVAVADEGHITRAAERLGIQQPPLTRQIRQLEDELGVALFERLPRGVRPTEAGRVVVEEARELLARAARIRDTAQRAARGEQGRLAVGYTSSAAFNPFVTQQIRAFRDARPGVLLALAEDGTPELTNGLREERLDAAFIRSASSDISGLSIEPLLEEKMVAAVPAGHRLADGRKTALADLADETFVFYRRPTGPGLYDAIMAACLAAGFSPTVGQEAPRMASTLSLVASGLGVSITPASMQRMNVEGVAFVRLKGAKGLTAPLLLATRKRDRSSLVERFRREVRAAAAALKAEAA